MRPLALLPALLLQLLLLLLVGSLAHGHSDGDHSAAAKAANVKAVLTTTTYHNDDDDDDDDDDGDDDKHDHHHKHRHKHEHSTGRLKPDKCEDYAEDFDCGLKNVKGHRFCSLNKCRALIKHMQGRSCTQYCAELGRTCKGAWEEVSDSCNVEETWSCNQTQKMFGEQTSDVICECSSRDGTPDPCAAQPGGGSLCAASGNESACAGLRTHANCPGNCKQGEAGCLAYACARFAKKLGQHKDSDLDLDDVAECLAWTMGVTAMLGVAMFVYAKRRPTSVLGKRCSCRHQQPAAPIQMTLVATTVSSSDTVHVVEAQACDPKAQEP